MQNKSPDQLVPLTLTLWSHLASPRVWLTWHFERKPPYRRCVIIFKWCGFRSPSKHCTAHTTAKVTMQLHHTINAWLKRIGRLKMVPILYKKKEQNRRTRSRSFKRSMRAHSPHGADFPVAAKKINQSGQLVGLQAQWAYNSPHSLTAPTNQLAF